jgi:hypothetical protein
LVVVYAGSSLCAPRFVDVKSLAFQALVLFFILLL